MAMYRVTVPFVKDMGSIQPFMASSNVMDTKEEYALWVINTMRDHDCLRPLVRLPAGTKFTLEE